VDDWLSKLIRKVGAGILVFTLLAFLLRLALNLIAPALPWVIVLLAMTAVLLFILRRPRGW
jgi:hypothetical protein